MNQLRDIRALICVAAAGSFTRAARQLNLSRSAVTKAVLRLEQSYQIRLLNRNNHFVSLTAAGERFVTDASAVLAGLDRLTEGLSEARNDLAGRIRLGLSAGCSEAWFYCALTGFLERHPDISIEMIDDDGRLDLVRESVDVSFRVAAGLLDTSLKVRRLAGLRQGLLAAPTYLDKHGAPEAPGDLARHACLLPLGERQTMGWRLNGNVFAPVKGRVNAQQRSALHQLALEGAGIAMLPLTTVRADLEAGRLHRVLPLFFGDALWIYALSPERLFRPRRVHVLIDHFATWLRQHEPDPALANAIQATA
jgi:DNA-binding transcriptional LysR family regulator